MGGGRGLLELQVEDQPSYIVSCMSHIKRNETADVESRPQDEELMYVNDPCRDSDGAVGQTGEEMRMTRWRSSMILEEAPRRQTE